MFLLSAVLITSFPGVLFGDFILLLMPSGVEHDPYYRYPWGDSIDGSKANYLAYGDPYETGANSHRSFAI